jgi:Co/Zn/Cd efflux system component
MIRDTLLPVDEQRRVETETAHGQIQVGEENDRETGTGWLGTRNLRALWGMLAMNTLFALSQLLAALIANSLSMISDSGSMLVDSFAYFCNILLEKRKHRLGPQATKLYEVYTSVFSVGLLVAVTGFSIADARSRLKNKTEDDTVDGRWVFGFAMGNLLVDIAMCSHYWYQIRHRRMQNFTEEVVRETKDELNMVSAFVHLFADTLRTLTSIIAGILESRMPSEAVSIDVFATFIVCGAILLAATFVFYEAFVQYREYRASKHQVGTENDAEEVSVTSYEEYT